MKRLPGSRTRRAKHYGTKYKPHVAIKASSIVHRLFADRVACCVVARVVMAERVECRAVGRCRHRCWWIPVEEIREFWGSRARPL